MTQAINTDNKRMRLYVTIRCKEPRKFRLSVSDYGRQCSKYASRMIECQGQREIFFSLPITPQVMNLEVIDAANPGAVDFDVEIQQKPLLTYSVWLDEDTTDFLKLATFFSQVCGFEPAAPTGRMFATSDNRFAIKYFTVIIDTKTKQPLSTPSRIGHSSGIIEASEQRFRPYTFAMRMMILLHEFSHKYRNPKMGLKISNEIGADINALYIYLGLGYSKVDAIYVYANVFLKAQTPQNIKRMRMIMDYIQRFENQEFAKRN